MLQEINSSISWDAIEQDSDFKSFDYETRKKVRKDYFDAYISPDESFQKLDSETQGRAYNDWINTEPKFTQAERNAKAEKIDFTGGDTLTGVKRGVQNVQAMSYGATALVGEGLNRLGADDIGKKIKNFGLTGYRRNVEEAKKYPSRYAFKDVYSGDAGISGAIDWAQGTFGSLVPSMAEAAIGAALGAAAGSSVGPEGTVIGGTIGAFTGRTILKKAIERGVEQAIKKGMGKEASNELRKAVTTQALKKLGSKIGMGAAIMPLESGSMYASLLDEKGIDAPGTALFFGALSTSLEYVGGNSKLVDTFIDALSNNVKGVSKKTAIKLLTNIPQEALQEGGQEVAGILNEIVNTKGDLITADHLESIIESMGAGALGGGAGAVVGNAVNGNVNENDSLNNEVTKRFENIKTLGADGIITSLDSLKQKINQNNQILQDDAELSKMANQSKIEVFELETFLTSENEINQGIVDLLNTELNPTEDAEASIEENIAQQRATQDHEEKISAQVQSITTRITQLQETANLISDPIQRNYAEDQITALVRRKNALLNGSNLDQGFEATAEPAIGSVDNSNPVDEFSQTDEQVQSAAENRKKTFESLQVNAAIKSTKDAANLYNSVLQKVRTGQQSNFTPEEDAFYIKYIAARNKEIDQREQLKRQADAWKTEQDLFNASHPSLPSKITSTGAFNDDQRFADPSQDEQFNQVSLNELEAKLTMNEQQLTVLTAQINAATDPNERMALHQEGSVLYDENDSLQVQIDHQVNLQEQGQGTIAEPTAETANIGAEFQSTNTYQNEHQLTLADIESMFPNQQINQDDDGTIHIKFKNGKGATFKNIQDVGKGFVKMAIETGQMSENGKILGVTVGNEVLLDANFADNQTMWHENKHVLDNLGMVTEADDSALNIEFNKLRKAGKLKFVLSTALDRKTGKPDTIQRMKENRANMFAQIMVDRATYRDNSKFKSMIQRVMDFFQQMFALGQQSIAGLARDIETGEIYSRQSTEQTTDPKFQSSAMRYTVPDQVLAGILNKRTETNTPEFKQWFDKSVAKTQEGDPLVFYHGTDGVFEVFDKDNTDQVVSGQSGHTSAGLGHFFTMQKELAGKYGQHVLPTYLKMNKPYNMSLSEAQSFTSPKESVARQAELKAQGYDSVIIKTGNSHYAVIFDSGQVKSIYNQGQWKDDNNIYFETREQNKQAQAVQGKQKLSDNEYNESFAKKNSRVQAFLQTARIRMTELTTLTDKTIGTISTRLGNANVLLKYKMRQLDFDTSQQIIKVLGVARPLLEKTKKMSSADKHAWDLARKQADTVKIQQIATRYGMLEDMEKLREELNSIRAQAQDVGYDVGFLDDYWPRIIKDIEGFLQATQGISQYAEFTEAIKTKAKSMGLSVKEFNRNFPDVRADVISSTILGKGQGMGGPGNIKSRVYKKIPKEFEKYYMDSDAALMQYIYSMTKKIEARKFFGKVPPKIQAHKNAITKAQIELNRLEGLGKLTDNNEVKSLRADRMEELSDRIALHNEALNVYKSQRNYTENIGAYISELMLNGDLNVKDEKNVREILEARFNDRGTTGITNTYKNLAYIDVMGNVVSAMTQITDLVWGAYIGKVWTPRGFSNTVKNTINATLGKSNLTKEELGLERIAQEFADGTTLGNAVSKVFKVVGLTKMDSIGKEVLINNALMNYQSQIKTDAGRKALAKKIKPIFGKETNQVIIDLGTGEHSENVKMLIYSKVLDFQPAALSEMPEFYLNGGNKRIFYMLKTYTIKQLDVFRNEVVHELLSGDPKRVAQGLKNMIALLALLTLSNAGVDELKDLVMGRETRFKDNVIENFLSFGGASRYMRMQVTREGIGTALAQQILPPFKFINSIGADIREKIVTGDIAKGLRSVESIPSYGPIGGKLWYWHYGRGSQTKRTLAEKDFSDDTKKDMKFKLLLKRSEDKRVFLQANKEEFKQSLLHRNFSSHLNKTKATINKLKKLTQTQNVIKRITQLEKQRVLLYARYFKLRKSLMP